MFLTMSRPDVVYAMFDETLITLLAKPYAHHKTPQLIVRITNYNIWTKVPTEGVRFAKFRAALSVVSAFHFIGPDLEEPFLKYFEKLGVSLHDIPRFVGDIPPFPGGEPLLEQASLVPINNMLDAPLLGREEPLRIICPARFTRPKRQEILAKAMALIPEKERPNLCFLGEGPRRREIEAMCDELGLSNSVIFSDFVAREKFLPMLGEFDLMVLPTDHEGLSRSVIDAMASGVAVLVSDVPGLSYIDSNVVGWKVTNTPEEWAWSLSWISQNRETASRAGLAGRRFIMDTYTERRIEERLVQFIVRIGEGSSIE